MKNRKNIIIILSIVLALGLVIEAARTQYLFKLGTNDNQYGYGKTEIINPVSKEELEKIKKEKFLIVYDSTEDRSSIIKENVERTLRYMKKEYITIDCKDYRGLQDEYSTIVLTFETLKNFPGLDDVMNYVSNGGKCFFAVCPENDGVFQSIYRKLGIYEAEQMVSEYGIKLLSNILIKGKGHIVEDSFLSNTYISVRLKKECNVYAVSLKDTPILWDSSYGKGKFMVFNGTMLEQKYNRGLIAGAISLLNEDFIYPVMNMKLAFIDDFPAPIPRQYMDNIYRGYGRSLPNFFREVWWSDILKGAKNYNLKYNSMVIEGYSDRVNPPFNERNSTDMNDLVIYGREVIKGGGEIGIHGYNHQPLALSEFIKKDMEYIPWEGEEDMIESIKEVNNYVNTVFPRYKLRSYVPPSNILSPEGREAVVESMPDLKVISSLYVGDSNGDEYLQEFEVSSDGIVELPRLSSGYSDSETNNWLILNGITSLGVFSHFIHPDDILDPERNEGKTWDKLSEEYDSLLKKVYKNFRWLRSMTVSESSMEVEQYSDCEVYVEHQQNSIKVYSYDFHKDLFFILRTNKKVVGQEKLDISNIDDGVYLIHTKKPIFTIELR